MESRIATPSEPQRMMTSMPSLDGIPFELIEQVVGSLDQKSVCNLRLVSHMIEDKVTGTRRFQSFFRTCSVNLSVEGLESFKHAISSSFGQYIRGVTLIGLVYENKSLNDTVKTGCKAKKHSKRRGCVVFTPCTDEELSQARQDNDSLQLKDAERSSDDPEKALLTLLRRAFDDLSASTTAECLESLSFEVRVIEYPNVDLLLVRDAPQEETISRKVFSVLSDTFYLGIQALKESKFKSVSALDIYTSAPASFCCGIPVDALSEVFGDGLTMKRSYTPRTSLTNIRKLSVSFTSPQLTTAADDHQTLATTFMPVVYGLTGLLRVCRHVEELHIGHCSPPIFAVRPRIRDFCKSIMFNQIRELMRVRPRKLRKLRLGGLELRDVDLAKLLTRFCKRIEQVELVALTIRGDLSTALAPLTHIQSLESFAMEAITVNRRPVEGDRDRDRPYPVITRGGTSRWNVIRREGDAARKPIDYVFRSGPETAEEVAYKQDLMAEYF